MGPVQSGARVDRTHDVPVARAVATPCRAGTARGMSERATERVSESAGEDCGVSALATARDPRRRCPSAGLPRTDGGAEKSQNTVRSQFPRDDRTLLVDGMSQSLEPLDRARPHVDVEPEPDVQTDLLRERRHVSRWGSVVRSLVGESEEPTRGREPTPGEFPCIRHQRVPERIDDGPERVRFAVPVVPPEAEQFRLEWNPSAGRFDHEVTPLAAVRVRCLALDRPVARLTERCDEAFELPLLFERAEAGLPPFVFGAFVDSRHGRCEVTGQILERVCDRHLVSPRPRATKTGGGFASEICSANSENRRCSGAKSRFTPRRTPRIEDSLARRSDTALTLRRTVPRLRPCALRRRPCRGSRRAPASRGSRCSRRR